MLDEKELMILSHLRTDARKNLSKIARATNIPVSTVFDKIKKYDHSIVERYTPILNFAELGYIKVSFTFSADGDDRQKLKQHILNNKNVNTAFTTNEGKCFFVEGIFKDEGEIELFTDELDQYDITEKKEHHIHEELKKEAFLTNIGKGGNK